MEARHAHLASSVVPKDAALPAAAETASLTREEKEEEDEAAGIVTCVLSSQLRLSFSLSFYLS